ncbi:hypothetical protein GCM10009616_31520 [Microlunatus lacustris]
MVDFNPNPWGRSDLVPTLLLTTTTAQPLAHDHANRSAGSTTGSRRAGLAGTRRSL